MVHFYVFMLDYRKWVTFLSRKMMCIFMEKAKNISCFRTAKKHYPRIASIRHIFNIAFTRNLSNFSLVMNC